MPRLRYLTAGESHGKELIGILEGMPAGLSLIASDDIDPTLIERQKGYGRSYRQKIESDKAEIISGVRFGLTTGAPIAIRISNKDWDNWSDKMSVTPTKNVVNPITVPRPGHADLAGSIKYQQKDIRNILERASARETAMRVALGSIAAKLLHELGIISVSYVISIGTVKTNTEKMPKDLEQLLSIVSGSSVRMFDPVADCDARALIDQAKMNGDTLGGVVEVQFIGLPIGIGSHVQWDRKLDGSIAQAVMSIQAVKAVEIGGGVEVAKVFGSECHDAILTENNNFVRSSNNAGGIEGGMSDGMPIIVRASMKPISTLMQPLTSVDLASGVATPSHIERSDVCAVPSLAVIVENVVAMTLASSILETFGGDTYDELRSRIEARREKSKLKNLIR